MQHYKEEDRMLTIHADRLIKEWTLKDAITPEEVREVFDYRLIKAPCYDFDGRKVPGLYHIQKETAEGSRVMPLGGFGEDYRVFQHADMLEMVAEKIMPELPGVKIETAGTLENGATGILQLSAGDDFRIDGDTSGHESRLYFSNPIGGGSLVMGFCVTRCVCENTIAIARREVLAGTGKGTGYSIRHTNNIDVYARAAIAQIAEQAKATKAMQERIKALAAKKATPKFVKSALDQIFPVTPEMSDTSPNAYVYNLNKREEVIAQWEEGETAATFKKDSAWKLVNAFTFPIFNPAKIAKGADLSGVRYDGLFGDRAEKVANIFETVERLAA